MEILNKQTGFITEINQKLCPFATINLKLASMIHMKPFVYTRFIEKLKIKTTFETVWKSKFKIRYK